VLQSVAGTRSIGGKGLGIGAALGWNSVFDTVAARVEHSTLSGITGPVVIRATSGEDDGFIDGKISSAAVGAGQSVGTALEGALAINGIVNTVDAHISNSTVTADGEVTVAATDSSSIKSLAGGAALAIVGRGGIGLSANFIANTITATIDSSTVNTG